MSAWAIVVAGGSGERFGRAGGKQLATVEGRPLLAVTLQAFELATSIDSVVLVCHPDRVDSYRAACGVGQATPKVAAVVAGGETRQASVSAGLDAIPVDVGVVAVHDGARPLVTPEVIDAAVFGLCVDPALSGIVVGHPVYDTLKATGGDAMVERTIDRSRLWVAQTPQVFRSAALRAAMAAAESEGFVATDDASLVERAGGSIRMLEGPRTNIKVTVPEDLTVVIALLRQRERDRETE